MGRKTPVAAAPPAPGARPARQAKAERPVYLTKAELAADCRTCGRSRLVDGGLVGCPCWVAALERAEVVPVDDGFAVRMSDRAALAAFVAEVRHGR